MNLMRVIRSLTFALGCVLLLGCPPEQELTLYNNSGVDLVALVGGERIQWKDREVLRFGGDGGLSWKMLNREAGPDGVRDPQLPLEWQSEVFVYPLALPGLTGRFLDRSTGLYRSVLQMQPDRRLYAVYADSDLPAQTPPSQPKGLPLAAL